MFDSNIFPERNINLFKKLNVFKVILNQLFFQNSRDMSEVAEEQVYEEEVYEIFLETTEPDEVLKDSADYEQPPVQISSHQEQIKQAENSLMPACTFKCQQCSFEGTSLNRLNLHQKIHKEKKLFECPDCDYTTNRKSYFQMHLDAHEKGTARKHSRKEELMEKQKSQKLFHCSECNYVSNSARSVTVHSAMHRPEKPFGCSYCPYRTKWKQVLKEHEKIHRMRVQELLS
ncbi:unnamed protein product [Allacma fusca]|uniref:C2H2-type domain-containing protein n=1 Tax=Allacma fusca TaxID=39272 RepID=A0A8J2K9E5_9HEXA|nr:unnamed protein product [Allacma fusca]